MAAYGKILASRISYGMGLNAFITFGVCKGMGYTPDQALGAVLIAGIA